jgi:WD40 repeat protein
LPEADGRLYDHVVGEGVETERRKHLRAWLRFLSCEARSLRERPTSFFQQAANQPQETVPARAALVRLHSGSSRAMWLRWVNKPDSVSSLITDIDATFPCAISRTGCLVAAAGMKGGLSVWDGTTGHERVQLLPPGQECLQCSFSADDGLVGVILAGGSFRLYDTKKGGELGEPFSAECTSAFAFLPDGRVLLGSWFSYTIHVLSTETSKGRMGKDMHLPGIEILAASPDGMRAASSACDGTLKLWDLATGEVRAAWRAHPGPVHSLAFSPDGRLLVTSSYSPSVGIWDATSGEEVDTVRLHSGDVSSCVFSPEGDLISVGSDGTAKRSDAFGARQPIVLIDGLILGTRGFLSGDGSRLLTASAEGLRVWETSGMRRREAHASQTRAGVFTADGDQFVTASGDGTLIIWDGLEGRKCIVLTDDPVKEIRPLAVTGLGNQVHCCALTRDGSRVASGHRDGAVRIWDARTGRLQTVFTGHAGVVSCAFASADHRIITLDEEGSLRWWFLDGPTPVDAGLAENVASFAFGGGDYSLLVGFTDGRLGILDLAGERALSEYPSLGGSVDRCVFAHEGNAAILVAAAARRIVAISAADGSVRFERNGLPPMARDLSGRCLAYQGDEGVIEILDLPTGERRGRVAVGPGDGEVWTCAFSSDGRYLAAAAEFGRVRLWRVPDFEECMAFWLDAPCRVLAWHPAVPTLVAGSLGGEVAFLKVEPPSTA